MSRKSHRRNSREKESQTLRFLNVFLLFIFVLLSLLLIGALISYNILSIFFLNVIIPVFLGVLIFIFFLFILRKKNAKTTFIALLASSLMLGLGLLAIKSVVDVSSRMNATSKISKTGMSVLVLKDSPISDVTELTNLSAPKSVDTTNIELLLAKLQKDKGLSLDLKEEKSYAAAYEKLVANETPAMIMNSAYVDLLASEYESFESSVKEIYSFTLEQEVQIEKKVDKTDKDTFNVYISGIDTYGSISSISRSDVNIIMTVNRKTKKVLLTTTPRDSYVPIAGGGNGQYDKLTHAGIYGVNSSIKTLENLYGIEIDHYARINFTSFMTLIDLVGGITVHNDQAFTSLHGNYPFPVGSVELDAERALSFVRERYSLTDGDNDRGKNQQKVLTALIEKLSSINSIAKYNEIMNNLGDSMQTDMKLEAIMSLLNDHLASSSGYDIQSQTLTGTGVTSGLTSHAMPNANLYMFRIDESSLENAKIAIQNMMEGN